MLLLLLVVGMKGISQKVEFINEPRKQAPFVMVLYEEANRPFVEEKIKGYKDDRGTSFLLFETRTTNGLEVIIDSLNIRLNYMEGIDKQRSYVLIIGDEEFRKKCKPITESPFIPNHYYLSTKEQTTISEVVRKLAEKYLWQVRLEDIRTRNVSDLNQNSIESGIFFKANAVIPSYGGIVTDIKPFFRTFSFGAYHSWGSHWQSNLEFTVGLNIPGQKKMQSEIQGLGTVKDEIEAEFKVHVLGSASLETRYLFSPLERNSRITPYAGIKIGFSAIAALDTLIEIDTDDIQRGGFQRPDGFDFDELESIASPSIGITSGLHYALSPKVIVDFGMSWNNDINSFSISEPYFNNLSFSVGFNFRFTGRKVLFYDYIQSAKSK